MCVYGFFTCQVQDAKTEYDLPGGEYEAHGEPIEREVVFGEHCSHATMLVKWLQLCDAQSLIDKTTNSNEKHINLYLMHPTWVNPALMTGT